MRENWATGKDAANLIAKLSGDKTCESDWELDSYDRLRSVMWSTQNQQIMARQFGGVVIQDNTCLTNR